MAHVHHGHPQVLIDVDVTARGPELYEKLSQGVLDAVIGWGPRVPAELESTNLLDVDFAFVAAPDRARRLGPADARAARPDTCAVRPRVPRCTLLVGHLDDRQRSARARRLP